VEKPPIRLSRGSGISPLGPVQYVPNACGLELQPSDRLKEDIMKVFRNLVAISLLCGGTAAPATETFQLFNGGKIQGEWLNPDESPRTTYQIRLSRGDIITLDRAQVTEVAGQSEAQAWYERWVSKVPDSAEGHLKMAVACKSHGLEAEWFYHLDQVLKRDKDHEQARRALGYSKIDGEWVKAETYFRERGFVRHQGKWRVPQELELQRVQQEQQEAELQWSRQIKQWRSWIMKRRSLAQEGMSHLASIEDVLAAPTLVELLNEKNEPRELRRVYIEVLGRLNVPVSTVALAQRVLFDNDEHIRDRALEFLVKRQEKGAVRLFIGSLNDPNNVVVNRAAMALNQLQDPEAIVPLIDALSTKHKFLISSGGGGELNPTFTNDPAQGGLGGFSMGNRPQVLIRELQNTAARDALVSLTGGANFGYNKEAWKHWYGRQTMPAQVNLRRDL
jgi:hypothetical protein